MRASIVASVAVSVLSSTSTFADQPRLRPSRDVAVVYRAPGPRGVEVEQRVRWLAAAEIMRIDPPSHDWHVIVDYVQRRMSLVDDAARSVVQMAAPDSANSITGAPSTSSYTRIGQGVVAGHTCTEWQTLDRQGHAALVCITDDGVLLRAGTPDAVRVSAISVQYGPQETNAFQVPADYTRVPPETPQ